ncbi:MAG: methyltransferase family protein [Acidimicrobiales bacterium]
MSDSQIGWLFVAAQIALLAGVVLLPTGDDWDRTGGVRLIALTINLIGLMILIVGVLGLGRSLTPSPMPMPESQLQTGGLYALVRHPIYTGVMALVVGVALGSGSIVRAGIAAATLLFFNIKARWEESRLVEKFPEYPAYATTVPRFIPRTLRP